jgi:hypothetical protein
MRRLAIALIAVVVLWWMMPPAARELAAPPSDLPSGLRGVIHIHTNRSDGTGSVDDVLRAAAAAGLKFAIVTDHGDGTRAPDLPDYRNGVLYIDGVEISTSDGHLIALGLPKAAYPLAGEGRDVVEDVHRLGGLAIAAHPGSEKPDLRWTDWTAPIDGLEWLNADSEWRDERPLTLARGLVTYPFRPPQALALLLDRPEPVIREWDALAQQRRVVGLAAVDAHARVGVRSLGEPYDSTGSLHFPSYASSFREFSITLPAVRPTGDAAADARSVLDAIHQGTFYSTVDALAAPAVLRMSEQGGRITVDTDAPDDARITLFRNGVAVANAQGARLEHDADAAVYRVEVTLPDSPGNPPVPWIMSNPIYVGREPEAAAPQVTQLPKARTFTTLYSGGLDRGWTIEKSAASDAAIDVIGALPGSQMLLRFALSGTAADSPYAAFAIPAGAAIATADRLVFTGRADRPMRVSVQLRAPGGEGERWRRSVYLDRTPRTIELPFADFRPVSTASAAQPVLSKVESVLFVIDTVNTKIGSNGQITIDDIKYGR